MLKKLMTRQMTLSTQTIETLTQQLTNGSLTLEDARADLKTRVSSPRFQQACQELHIPLSQLKLKKLEDFGGSGIYDEVRLVRYEHYCRKYIETLLEIVQKRKEISSIVTS
jgi:hypothetical protein